MKKKPLIVGIAIGVLARPVVLRMYQPFHAKVQQKLYNLAFDFMQNFEANHPS